MAALPLWRRAANLVFSMLQWVFRTFTAAITALLILSFLASTFSAYINPNSWILSAYLGLFYPVFVSLMLIWLIFLAITHRKHCLIAMGIAFLMGCMSLFRYCPLNLFGNGPIEELTLSDGTKKQISVDTLKVMTFNTHTMGGAKLWHDKEPLPLMEEVDKCGADVVCLQEYSFHGTGMTEQKIRKMVAKNYPFYCFVPGYNSTTVGVAIYSKYPIKRYQKVGKADVKYSAIAYAELEVNGRKMGLVNCYLRSFVIPPQDRRFMGDMIDGNKFEKDSLKRVETTVRHLAPAFRDRANQVDDLKHFIAELPADMPLLVCGDMNDTPISYVFHTLSSHLEDTWSEVGVGLGTSFRTFPFQFRIDHIFHSEHFHALDVRVLRDVKESDHFPVMATFQMLPVNN